MKNAETAALMKTFGAAIRAGNGDGIAACLADDFVWNLPTGEADPQGSVIRGKEAARDHLLQLAAEQKNGGLVFSDASFEFVGELALMRYRVRGARDGKKIDAMGFEIYRVREGKIRSKDAYWKLISWPAA